MDPIKALNDAKTECCLELIRGCRTAVNAVSKAAVKGNTGRPNAFRYRLNARRVGRTLQDGCPIIEDVFGSVESVIDEPIVASNNDDPPPPTNGGAALAQIASMLQGLQETVKSQQEQLNALQLGSE